MVCARSVVLVAAQRGARASCGLCLGALLLCLRRGAAACAPGLAGGAGGGGRGGVDLPRGARAP